MNRKISSKHLGLIFLLIVVAIAGGYMTYKGAKPQEVYLKGYLGGEKKGLFEDEDFKDYIHKTYGLTLDYKVAGSYNMVQADLEGQNYLFPSSQLALELFEKQGRKAKDDGLVFNTPIVLYSRKLVVEALKKHQIVNERDGVNYVDMTKLAKMIAKPTSWAELGLPQLYGNVLVDTTDPNQSNSGNMFLGLLANALNGNQVVNMGNVAGVEEEIKSIYQAIGFMQTSSSDMFSQFMKQGVGAYPIIAGYESQLLEFSKTKPEVYEKIREDVMILYPEPTVWSSHVYIALDDEAKMGLKALMDEKVQEMAWKNHGYRTIVSGTGDQAEFDVTGVAGDITQIMSMPDIDTMQYLMKTIR